MATDNSIKIHQYQGGGKAVLVEFGKGKIGIGLHDNSVMKRRRRNYVEGATNAE